MTQYGLGMMAPLVPPLPLQSSSQQVTVLGEMAAALSPGMAKVLEKLVAGHLCGVRPVLTFDETMLLQCAGAALSVVNRTPVAAQDIGRGAARAVSSNPDAFRLIDAAASLDQRRLAAPGIPGRGYGR